LSEEQQLYYLQGKSMGKPTIEIDGFEEVSMEHGMADGRLYTDSCSGSRSDCCTRTCSRDESFVPSEDAWEAFLKIEGGQVQY
jgi:hypothetical protein